MINKINVFFNEAIDQVSPSGRLLQIFELFDYIGEKTSHLTEGLLEVHIITTDPDYRRQGMAKALVDVTEELARNNRLRGVKMACTSEFSAKLAQSLAYKESYRLAYSDYKDGEGRQVFFPPKIHTHVKLYTKEFT